MPLPFSRRIAWRIGWWFYTICWLPIFRTRATGKHHIPRDGPLLLLSNHTSLMDPPHVAWPCWRPVHFMATEQLFRISPALTWLITTLNAFPKIKGVKDKHSMMELDRRYHDGGIVNFYPEGERTWDGRLLPIVPTTARFLKRMKARVVYARIKTGHLNHPRWAVWPRWVPLEVEYSRLYVYDDPNQPDEEIMNDIRENLRVNPESVRARRPCFGFRMAEGLPAFLWACPACFTEEALSVQPQDRNAVQCAHCGAAWRVDVSQRLQARGGPATDTHVIHARDAIEDHFGPCPASNPDRLAATGIALDVPEATLREVKRGDPTPQPAITGTAVLTADAISLQSHAGETLWSLQLTDVLAINMQVGNRLQLRTTDRNFQLDPPDSSIKWCHFARCWWRRARNRADA